MTSQSCQEKQVAECLWSWHHSWMQPEQWPGEMGPQLLKLICKAKSSQKKTKVSANANLKVLAGSWHNRMTILQTSAAKELTYQKQNALAKISQVVKMLHLFLGHLVPANTVFFSTWPCSLQPLKACQAQIPFAGPWVEQPFSGPFPRKGSKQYMK